MATTAPTSALDHKLSRSPGKLGMLVFGAVLLVGVLYAGTSLLRDLSTVHSESFLPYLLLAIALLVALGFEFVNGFHDTAQRRGLRHLYTLNSSLTSPSYGPPSGTSLACSPPAAWLLSLLSRYFRWN